MKDIVERCGAIPVIVDAPWGEAVAPEKVEAALKENSDAKILAFVHAETSTGALTDAKTLVELAHKYDCLTIVDTVTSLGGVPVLVDEWGIDASYSGSQKCLSCPPGLSPISMSERAVAAIKGRAAKVPNWYLDLTMIIDYWEGKTRTYHHTAPINMLYGLYQAVGLILDEGLDAVFERHRSNHERLVSGLAELGLEMLVAPECRLPMLNAVRVPGGVDEAAVRQKLRMDHLIEIGPGIGPLAGKIWRIGLMGHTARPENVDRLLSALNTILR